MRKGREYFVGYELCDGVWREFAVTLGDVNEEGKAPNVPWEELNSVMHQMVCSMWDCEMDCIHHLEWEEGEEKIVSMEV